MRFWRKRKPSTKSNKPQLSMERLEERAMMAVIPLASGQTARFYDADGSEVKVKLLGPGAGTIELVGGVLSNASIDTLSLTGTTAATTLKISTRGGSVHGTTINDVVIDNAVGQLDALKLFKGKHVTITGDFTADGSIGDFHVRALGNGANVEVNGDVGRFKSENLAHNARLEVAGTLREFVAKLLASGSVVEANQLDMLKVKQQAVGASFHIGEGGLGQAKLGWIYNTTFQAAGAIGNVVVKGDAMGSGFGSNIDAGSDGQYGTIDDFTMDENATGYVGPILFRGNVGGNYDSQMVTVASSDGIAGMQMRRGQHSNIQTVQGDYQYIPLDISQISAAATGFTDQEIFIAIFGEEIAVPAEGVAPPPAQNYYYAPPASGHTKPQVITTQGLTPNNGTPNLPIVPSQSISAWNTGTSNNWGSNLQIRVPKNAGTQFTGRIVISAGAPVQAQINQDAYHSVSAPSAADFTDPSTGTYYDFLEFTVTNSGPATAGGPNVVSLDMDTSQVDSFGMPISLQFRQPYDTNTQTYPIYQNTFTGTTDLNSPLQISGVSNLNNMILNGSFGTGQPVTGPGIQPGTVVASFVNNGASSSITLNLPITSATASGNFISYPGGTVGVQEDRRTIMTGFTDDGLFQFLQTKLENGDPQARPFLQSATPYPAFAAQPLTAATTAALVISTANTTGLTASDHVTVTGVLDNVAANGTFVVADVTSNSFILGAPISNGSTGGAWTLAGSSTSPMLESPSTNGQPVVIQTGNTFGLQNGDSVLISGATGITAVNGLHTVSAVTPTSFTLFDVNGTSVTVEDGAWQEVEAFTTTSANGDPLVLTTTTNTDRVNVGGVITISGLTGAGAPNGSFIVTAKTATSITLGSPAGLGGYVANTGHWQVGNGPTHSVTGASRGGEIQITAVSTAGLSNGDLVQISEVGGNLSANGFYFVSNLTPTSFTLSGSSGSGTYTSGGKWQVHVPAMRLVSPKDIVESLLSPQDKNALNNYYNEVIDDFFLQHYTGTMNGHQGGGQPFSLQSTAYDGTARTYTGSVTNVGTAGGNYALQLKDSTTMNPDPTTYNIYYPWFEYDSGAENNAPSPDIYSPVFTLAEAPSWITSNAWQTQSASQMIFGCDAVFADNVARAAIDMTGNNAVKVLGDLENSISAAFNRGIILNDAASWYDTTQWFPETGTYNYWVEYWHQTGLMHSDLAYAFPYDDKFGASTNLDIAGVGLVEITLGSWGTGADSNVAFTHVPQNASPDSEVTLTAQVTGASPTGTVTFFVNGIPLNPDDDSLTAPMRPVDLNGSGLASVTATLPALPSGANSATYTVTAVYSGDANNLPSIVATSLPLTSALVVSVAPATGPLGQPVTIYTTLPNAGSSGTLTYSISKSDGSNPVQIGQPVQFTNQQNVDHPVSIPTNVVTFTGTASGNNMITGISNADMIDLLQNQVVSGTGVPTGTTITNIDTNNNSLTLSNSVTAGTVVFTSNGAGAELPITVTYNPGNSLPLVLGGTDFLVTAQAFALTITPGSGALGSTPTVNVTLPGPPYNGTIDLVSTRTDGSGSHVIATVPVNSNTLIGNTVSVSLPMFTSNMTAITTNSSATITVSTVANIVPNQQLIAGTGIPASTTITSATPASLTLNGNATASGAVTLTADGVTFVGFTTAGSPNVNVTSTTGWTTAKGSMANQVISGSTNLPTGTTISNFTAATAVLSNIATQSGSTTASLTSYALNYTAYANGATLTNMSTSNIDPGTTVVTGTTLPATPATTVVSFIPAALTLSAPATSSGPVVLTVGGITIYGTTTNNQATVDVTTVEGWTPTTPTLSGQAITGDNLQNSTTVVSFTPSSTTLSQASTAAANTLITITSGAQSTAYPISAVWTPTGGSSITSPAQMFGIT